MKKKKHLQTEKHTNQAEKNKPIPWGKIVGIVPDAIIVIDESQIIRLFNRGAEEIFGYRTQEVLGKPLEILLPPEVVERHRAHIHTFASSPETARMMGTRSNVSGRRKDGSIFPAEASISQLQEEQKTSFCVVLRDITEQKQAEEYLQRITDQAPGALYEFQISPDGAMSFPFISKGIADIHPGLTAEMLKNDASLGFSTMHPDDMKRIQASIETSYRTLTNWDVEFRVIADDGSILWHQANAKPEKGEDGTVTWYGIFQDITERRQAIAKIQQQARLLDEASDAIILRDLQHNILYWNKSAERIFGWSAEEVVGKDIREILYLREGRYSKGHMDNSR